MFQHVAFGVCIAQKRCFQVKCERVPLTKVFSEINQSTNDCCSCCAGRTLLYQQMNITIFFLWFCFILNSIVYGVIVYEVLICVYIEISYDGYRYVFRLTTSTLCMVQQNINMYRGICIVHVTERLSAYNKLPYVYNINITYFIDMRTHSSV